MNLEMICLKENRFLKYNFLNYLIKRKNIWFLFVIPIILNNISKQTYKKFIFKIYIFMLLLSTFCFQNQFLWSFILPFLMIISFLIWFDLRFLAFPKCYLAIAEELLHHFLPLLSFELQGTMRHFKILSLSRYQTRFQWNLWNLFLINWGCSKCNSRDHVWQYVFKMFTSSFPSEIIKKFTSALFIPQI